MPIYLLHRFIRLLTGNISLQNTKNIILENWQGPITHDAPRTPVYHFAIMQKGISLEFHLKQFFKKQQYAIHFFHTFEELVLICQRYPIDIIMVGGGHENTFVNEVELVRSIKENVFLSIIPVILFHPSPDENIVIAAYQKGAEDFIYGDWREKLVQVRIQRVIDRHRRDISINPSTQLPGPTIIEREMERLIENKIEFAVCYADLDNFKAYNDYYGYFFGDKVIRLTAKVIKDTVFDICREGFVGHIAGDDFIYIIPVDEVDSICSAVLETFDRLIPLKYKYEDRKRGFIESKNRKGEPERFSMLTMSIAVLVNQNGTFKHLGEMSKMLADLKKAVKQQGGSNYMVERRKKY